MSDSPRPGRSRLLTLGAPALLALIVVGVLVAVSQRSADDDDDAPSALATAVQSVAETAAATTAADAGATASATAEPTAAAAATATAAASATPATTVAATTVATTTAATVDAPAVAGVAEAAKLLDGIPQNGDTLGDPDAPVTILEYADLRCPVCKQYAEIEFPKLIENTIRPGKAKLRFVLWPILGEDSVNAAYAGLAAAEQDRLFQFAALWYANQGDERDTYATDPYIHTLAGAAGIDIPALDAARGKTTALQATLAEQWAAAEAAKLPGTPSFVVVAADGTQKVFADNIPLASDLAAAVQDLSGS